MSEIDLKLLVKKALLNYDIKNSKYKDVISSKNYTYKVDNNILEFTDLNKKFKYNILGIFDKSNQIWIWSWLIPEYKYNDIEYVKKLLDYGIKISPSKLEIDKLFIKTQLVNSRFLLYDSIQLDIHLAIASYLLKDNFDFVFQLKKN